MIKEIYNQDNISIITDKDIIINPVNCDDNTNNKYFLYFKKNNKFQNMIEEYHKICVYKKMKVGKLFIYTKTFPNIVNFPIKENENSKILEHNIKKNLISLLELRKSIRYNSIVFPNLNKIEKINFNFKELLNNYFYFEDIDVFIHM